MAAPMIEGVASWETASEAPLNFRATTSRDRDVALRMEHPTS